MVFIAQTKTYHAGVADSVAKLFCMVGFQNRRIGSGLQYCCRMSEYISIRVIWDALGKGSLLLICINRSKQTQHHMKQHYLHHFVITVYVYVSEYGVEAFADGRNGVI